MIATLDPDTLFSGLASASGLLLAVSGGPDSTALLVLIDRWRKTAGVPVAIATVDHGMREESAREASAVAAMCQARGLPHHTLVWQGEKPTTRLQERAREARYALLAQCARDVGADTIVTAHHADDQAETILMRLTRGSGVTGLSGMAPRTERAGVSVARPLLALSKSDLIEICSAEGVSYAIDPSNTDRAFRRSALRDLAPILAAQGLDTEALCRLGRRIARTEAALQWAQEEARQSLQPTVTDSDATFPARELAMLPEEIALRLLAAEVMRLSYASRYRLDRLEALTTRLRAAILLDDPFAATLGGCLVRFRHGKVTIAPAPARRITPESNDSSSREEHRYLSSPALLGKAGGDA